MTPTLTRPRLLVPGRRWSYLDEIKVLVITGVIVVHVAITYGSAGSWYLADLDESTTGAGEIVLSLLAITGALFAMGLLFLVAGSLAVPSLDRKGARRFVFGRLRRLGIPLLAFIVLASPPLEYVAYRTDGGTEGLVEFLRHHTAAWVLAPGPLWFVEALLVFSLGYAAWVTVHPTGPPTTRLLTGRDVARLVIAVAAASFLTRLAFPLGSEQFHLQLALFPQYVILFAFGAMAWRRGWLVCLNSGLHRRCRLAALTAAIALPGVIALGGGLDDGSPVLGGWHWQALVTAVIDSALACCASLWLLEAFRRRRRRGEPGPFGRSLARSAYGAYIVHPLVVVPLALAVHPIIAPAELKFLVIAPAAVAGSFALAALANRRPRIRRAGRLQTLPGS